LIVEEHEFKSTYREIAGTRCEFEKALTNNKAQCALARHFWLADREGYACKSEEAAAKCRDLLIRLRENSRFILKLQQTGVSLPHNMEIRVQAGGLSGISSLVTPGQTDKIADISALVAQAEAEFSGLGNLPYGQIVQSISRYQGRRSRKRS
jgi:hypothetical protein